MTNKERLAVLLAMSNNNHHVMIRRSVMELFKIGRDWSTYEFVSAHENVGISNDEVAKLLALPNDELLQAVITCEYMSYKFRNNLSMIGNIFPHMNIDTAAYDGLCGADVSNISIADISSIHDIADIMRNIVLKHIKQNVSKYDTTLITECMSKDEFVLCVYVACYGYSNCSKLLSDGDLYNNIKTSMLSPTNNWGTVCGLLETARTYAKGSLLSDTIYKLQKAIDYALEAYYPNYGRIDNKDTINAYKQHIDTQLLSLEGEDICMEKVTAIIDNAIKPDIIIKSLKEYSEVGSITNRFQMIL